MSSATPFALKQLLPALIAGFCCSTTAWAGKAAADLTEGFGNSKNTAGATTDLFVSTYIGGPPEATRSYNATNQFFATSTRTAGVDNPKTFAYNNAAPGTTLNAAFAGGPFSTILGRKKLAKPTVASKDDGPAATGVVSYGLHSMSDPYSASAGNDSIGVYTFASKDKVNKVVGAAGSIAYDPFTLKAALGPSYAYAPTINGSLQLEPDESGGIAFFGADSSVYSGDLGQFVEEGQDFANTSWTLSISASGLIASLSDLVILYYVNPNAVSQWDLSTTPGFSPAMTATELADLVEGYALSMLMNGGITIDTTDGTADLANFLPFAQGTKFTPTSGSTEELAFGALASITAVPEPASLIMVLAGLLGLIGLRRSSSTGSST